MILFDTEAVPVRDRVDSVNAALRDVTVAAAITHEGPQQDISWRMDYWGFGTADVIATEGTGFRLLRAERHLRIEAPPVVALSMQFSGSGWFEHLDCRRPMALGDLMLVDLTAAYEFGWVGRGGNQGLQVGYDVLGLPVGLVRRAVARLEASPLCAVMRHHMNTLRAHGDSLSLGAAAPAVGTASADLLRALIVSAAGDEAYARPVMAQTLATRVLAYLGQHVTDPELSPEMIAAEHAISVRQLYKVCELEGFSLEQRIIELRLEGARAALVAESARHRTIEAVARSCGFSDPSYFSRRFRTAYGVSPREWQRSHWTASAHGVKSGA